MKQTPGYPTRHNPTNQLSAGAELLQSMRDAEAQAAAAEEAELQAELDLLAALGQFP